MISDPLQADLWKRPSTSPSCVLGRTWNGRQGDQRRARPFRAHGGMSGCSLQRGGCMILQRTGRAYDVEAASREHVEESLAPWSSCRILCQMGIPL